jgi:hypothetical protein
MRGLYEEGTYAISDTVNAAMLVHGVGEEIVYFIALGRVEGVMLGSEFIA